MGIEITGLDEIRRKLEKLQHRVANLNGPVSFDDLFPPEFMRRYTDFLTMDDMIKASGHEVKTAADFEAIPDDEWDNLVNERTRFKDWSEMKNKAAGEYAERRLNLENL